MTDNNQQDQLAYEAFKTEFGDLLTRIAETYAKIASRGDVRAFEYFALVIEGSLSDIVSGRYQSGMTAKSAVQSLLAFRVRYRLPIVVCENRAYSQRVKYFYRWWKRACKSMELPKTLPDLLLFSPMQGLRKVNVKI